MEQIEMSLAVKLVNAGLKLLRQRMLRLLALLLTFVLFAWCVWQPEPFRIVSASIFGFIGYMMTKQDEEGGVE